VNGCVGYVKPSRGSVGSGTSLVWTSIETWEYRTSLISSAVAVGKCRTLNTAEKMADTDEPLNGDYRVNEVMFFQCLMCVLYVDSNDVYVLFM